MFCFYLLIDALLQGPQGPKTLCNACGLRWAKLMRPGGKEDEDGKGDKGEKK
jgi:hypothetical protein